MNKLIIVLALALSAVASIHSFAANGSAFSDEASQFAFFEDDKTETGSLDSNHQMFADFCLQARDDVKAYVKNSMNENAAAAFVALSGQVGEVAGQVLDAEKASVAKGLDMIKEDARQSPRAVGGVLSAIVDGIKVGFMDKLGQLHSLLNRENLRDQVLSACGVLVETIQPLVQSRLEQTKHELLSSDVSAAQKEVIEATKLKTVGCVMTNRMSKMVLSCLALMAIPVEKL